MFEHVSVAAFRKSIREVFDRSDKGMEPVYVLEHGRVRGVAIGRKAWERLERRIELGERGQ